MAATRHQSDIQTSIRGRELGFDNDRFLCGPLGYREPFETLAAASTMETFGTTTLTGTTATYTLLAPEKLGQLKEIINASSISTAAMAIVRSTANGACNFLPVTSGTTEGATEGNVKRLNLIQVGSRVVLRAISSAQWAPISFPQSSLYFTLSTSS
jgi:hypothetical protein